jgi:hypothetical protein
MDATGASSQGVPEMIDRKWIVGASVSALVALSLASRVNAKPG